jgi:2-methylisocitrate lyase-like PEP mutase family enzyme
MDPATLNEVAKRFKQMHVPGSPVVLVNVYDAASATKLLEITAAKAVATASYPIAATQGIPDKDLTFEQNLATIRTIGMVTSRAKIPLTVDVQDGYDDVAVTIKAIIQAGAAGCNLEDLNNAKNTLRSKDEAAERIKLALKVARDAGVPDFVVNARSDVLNFDGTIGDALDRAQAYLAVGATTALFGVVPKGEVYEPKK